MHMMDIFIEDIDFLLVKDDYIAYISGRERSMYTRNKSFVQDALEGNFDSARSAIQKGLNADFDNPFLLHDILYSAVCTTKANKNEKLDFIKFLLTLAPLVKFIAKVPHSVTGRIGDYFINHSSIISEAVSLREQDVLRIFIEFYDEQILSKSGALSVAARDGLADETAIILSKYKIFTQNEINALNAVDKMIKDRKLSSSNIDTMTSKMRELIAVSKNTLTLSNTITTFCVPAV